mmetsp:Transcript_15217/g.28660  ORF Transcript_15217/g.28660 Transcript_15217/m.28660 type:complete len:227 (+) Transcript_15217:2371-3051(+)
MKVNIVKNITNFFFLAQLLLYFVNLALQCGVPKAQFLDHRVLGLQHFIQIPGHSLCHNLARAMVLSTYHHIPLELIGVSLQFTDADFSFFEHSAQCVDHFLVVLLVLFYVILQVVLDHSGNIVLLVNGQRGGHIPASAAPCPAGLLLLLLLEAQLRLLLIIILLVDRVLQVQAITLNFESIALVLKMQTTSMKCHCCLQRFHSKGWWHWCINDRLALDRVIQISRY